jgi:hypothetical protein
MGDGAVTDANRLREDVWRHAVGLFVALCALWGWKVRVIRDDH